MRTHSIRDLESIDGSTLIGRSELRNCLLHNFGVSSELADWVIHLVEENNNRVTEFIERIAEIRELKIEETEIMKDQRK